MKVFLSLNEDNRVISWGSSPLTEKYFETDLPLGHEVLSSPTIYVLTVDNELVREDSLQLIGYKKEKEEELSLACKRAILDGFFHTINEIEYKFSFDTESQLNFQGAERILSQGLIETISWTVKEEGIYKRIPVDVKTMNELTFVILRHKDSNISRFREFLMPLVKEAITIEEVELVKW